LADHETAKPPPDLIYEDTGAMAPVVYFDIIGAYGTMHGAIETGGFACPNAGTAAAMPVSSTINSRRLKFSS
jgi:hypothetical protein